MLSVARVGGFWGRAWLGSAGGRSRSPAVAISYLMTKDKLSFDAAADHVKAFRPVVSLNAGFEAQLRCLERANGDVFSAHQLHLQSKLSRLLQYRLDGSLDVVTKRRQNRHVHHHQQLGVAPRTPPHSSPGSLQPQCERRVSCCDDRGMLDGSLPSGFCLSLPLAAARKKKTKMAKKTTQFIPALRSMGSMFGCRACGEHLFCASAVVQHSALSTELNHHTSGGADSRLLSPPTSTSGHGNDDAFCFPFDELIAGDTECTANSVPGAVERAASQPPPPPDELEAKKTRKPLLAKLRLRPQSPTVVSSPTGSDKSTPRSTTSSTGSSSTPVAALPPNADTVAGKPEPSAGLRDEVAARIGGGGVLKSLKKEKTAPKDDGSAGKLSTSGASSALGGKSGNSSDKFWRSITAFATTKRIFKDSKEKQRQLTPTPLQPGAGDDKKRVKTDAGAKCEASESLFLRENAAAWERSLRAIEIASSSSARDESTVLAEVAALIAADSNVLARLSCDEWFIEPQEWFLDSLTQSPSGTIRCPSDSCGAVVGEWRWDGLTYVRSTLLWCIGGTVSHELTHHLLVWAVAVPAADKPVPASR